MRPTRRSVRQPVASRRCRIARTRRGAPPPSMRRVTATEPDRLRAAQRVQDSGIALHGGACVSAT